MSRTRYVSVRMLGCHIEASELGGFCEFQLQVHGTSELKLEPTAPTLNPRML